MTAPALLIGSPNSEFLRITPLRKTVPGATNISDANWVEGEVQIAVGGFRGRFEAYFETTDFARLARGLRELYQTLKGEVQFAPIEEQLTFSVTGDGRGHFLVKGQARDEPGVGHRLSFELAIDQTQLPALLAELDAIASAYPVIR